MTLEVKFSPRNFYRSLSGATRKGTLTKRSKIKHRLIENFSNNFLTEALAPSWKLTIYQAFKILFFLSFSFNINTLCFGLWILSHSKMKKKWKKLLKSEFFQTLITNIYTKFFEYCHYDLWHYLIMNTSDMFLSLKTLKLKF